MNDQTKVVCAHGKNAWARCEQCEADCHAGLNANGYTAAPPAPALAGDHAKLVTRLLNDRWPGKELLAIEAADAITALSAENELLQRELTVIDAMLNPSCTSGVTIESAIRSLQAELAAMRGDRERMRACVAAADAMRNNSDLCHHDSYDAHPDCQMCRAVNDYDIARAAIAQKEQSNG